MILLVEDGVGVVTSPSTPRSWWLATPRRRPPRISPTLLASRTVLLTTAAPARYATLGQTIGWQAADITNGNRFPATGKEIVVARNNAGTDQTVTIRGAPDEIIGRSQDQVLQIAPGDIAFSTQLPTNGWRQADLYVWVDSSSASIDLAVIVLP